MQHSKHRPQRRRHSRMAGHKKRGPSTKSLNKKIHHIENSLIELKYYDIFDNGGVAANLGVFDYVSGVAQGDTASERNGNIITPTSLLMRIQYQTDPLNLDGNLLRVIVFWDTQCNGSNPILTGNSTSQSLLDSTVIGDGTLMPRNYNTIKRYKVLFDRTIHIETPVAGTVGGGITTHLVPMRKQINARLKLSRTIKYNNTTSAITACTTNALHVAYFNSESDTQNDGIIYTGYRLYYRDA